MLLCCQLVPGRRHERRVRAKGPVGGLVCAFSLVIYAGNCPAGQASPAATQMRTLSANHASTPPADARRSSSLSCMCRMTASPSSTCCRYRWSCAGRVGVNRDDDWKDTVMGMMDLQHHHPAPAGAGTCGPAQSGGQEATICNVTLHGVHVLFR